MPRVFLCKFPTATEEIIIQFRNEIEEIDNPVAFDILEQGSQSRKAAFTIPAIQRCFDFIKSVFSFPDVHGHLPFVATRHPGAGDQTINQGSESPMFYVLSLLVLNDHISQSLQLFRPNVRLAPEEPVDRGAIA